MIIDKIENMHLYAEAFPQLLKVQSASLACLNGETERSGRTEIDADRLYYSVSSYTTKPAEGAEYESHFIYADVQVVLEGSETIGWAPLCDCEVTKPAKDGGDIAFYTSTSGSPLTLHSGYFALFLPGDAHMPCLHPNGKPEQVTKMVFKVKLS